MVWSLKQNTVVTADKSGRSHQWWVVISVLQTILLTQAVEIHRSGNEEAAVSPLAHQGFKLTKFSIRIQSVAFQQKICEMPLSLTALVGINLDSSLSGRDSSSWEVDNYQEMDLRLAMFSWICKEFKLEILRLLLKFQYFPKGLAPFTYTVKLWKSCVYWPS